jgi:hypothetical protein
VFWTYNTPKSFENEISLVLTAGVPSHLQSQQFQYYKEALHRWIVTIRAFSVGSVCQPLFRRWHRDHTETTKPPRQSSPQLHTQYNFGLFQYFKNIFVRVYYTSFCRPMIWVPTVSYTCSWRCKSVPVFKCLPKKEFLS